VVHGPPLVISLRADAVVHAVRLQREGHSIDLDVQEVVVRVCNEGCGVGAAGDDDLEGEAKGVGHA